MAHKKAGGSTKNISDSQPKYLGIKLSNGCVAKMGAIIVRQRGTPYLAGKGVGIGKDHTLFALRNGVVRFNTKRKVSYTGRVKRLSRVSIV
ncbi:MAG TPA: 50S ribosomal protein L27 [Candidatus Paceibacterota bacterium]